VRLDSSRLPAKAMLKISRDHTVLEHCVARCYKYNLIPVIATDEKSYKHLKYLKYKFDINIEYGPKENKLKRLAQIANSFRMPVFHTVDPDDPFFCPDRIKESLSLSKKGSVIFPSNYSDQGGGTEGYTFVTDDLKNILDLADTIDTSMVQAHISSLRRIIMKDPIYAFKQTRLTLDYIEDYLYFLDLFEKFDYQSSRKDIEKFILENNKFDNLFLNERWKQKQLKEMKNE